MGNVAGKNSKHLGVRYDDDPDPPATGNWVPKSKLKRLSEVPALECGPELTAIHVKDARGITGLSFDLAKHQARHIILTGPNGSGKSTILTGLVEAIRRDHRLEPVPPPTRSTCSRRTTPHSTKFAREAARLPCWCMCPPLGDGARCRSPAQRPSNGPTSPTPIWCPDTGCNTSLTSELPCLSHESRATRPPPHDFKPG